MLLLQQHCMCVYIYKIVYKRKFYYTDPYKLYLYYIFSKFHKSFSTVPIYVYTIYIYTHICFTVLPINIWVTHSEGSFENYSCTLNILNNMGISVL